MKYIYLIMITVLLSSCFADKETVKVEPVDDKVITIDDIEKLAEEETLKEIEEEISNIEIVDVIENDNIEDEIEKLDATYVNGGGNDVDMTVQYELDENDLIKTINVSDSNGDKKVAGFNDAIQKELIGKSLEEAGEFTLAGSSLTSEAFTNALK